ncbi:urease accessory protein UreD [Methylopila henanensis]|uniref:Urease accessory protein UreD n=1 Tax=Methylopila henanensis TaxID=873516 RepID=A0ABW4K0D9_9HYPH
MEKNPIPVEATKVRSDGRQRAKGAARVAFARRGPATRLADLEQAGALRVLFPRPEPGTPPCAVLANIGGGVAGGDRLDVEIAWGEGAEAAVTTQAAEKTYRAVSDAAVIANRLTVAGGAVAHWLPQETILFDGARLERSFDADLADDAELLACDSFVFGRSARGERVEQGRVFDRWRVRRGGRLVFADALELDDAVAERLDRPAVAAGGLATATLLLVSQAAEARLSGLREAFASGSSEAGASVFDGCLVARLVARDAAALRRDVAAAIGVLSGRPPPRVFAF